MAILLKICHCCQIKIHAKFSCYFIYFLPDYNDINYKMPKLVLHTLSVVFTSIP